MNIQPDKLGHFMAGTIIYTITFVLAGIFQADKIAIIAGLVLVIIAGIGKEMLDRYRNNQAIREGKSPPHGVEVMDALWTIAGGVVCALPNVLMLLSK